MNCATLISASLAAAFFVLTVGPVVPAADPAPKKFMVYVGTYTGEKKSEGIYRMELDLATGALLRLMVGIRIGQARARASYPSIAFSPYLANHVNPLVQGSRLTST